MGKFSFIKNFHVESQFFNFLVTLTRLQPNPENKVSFFYFDEN